VALASSAWRPIADPALVGTTIAQALGIREVGSTPLVDRLVGFLGNQRFLLILDNFERVLAAGPLIAELLGRCPGLTILVTSRVRLRISGEHEHVTPPLASAPKQAIAASEVGHWGAIQLFVERAQAVREGFALTDANARTVADICQRLEGLPLAIELAAPRVNILPPAAPLARLGRRLPLLTGGGRDLPDRQRTMRSTISWSYDLLRPSDQGLLRRLAIFVGGFTLDAGEAVVGSLNPHDREILDGLAVLTDASLLQSRETEDGEPRFGML
jgi:predicted ATPase